MSDVFDWLKSGSAGHRAKVTSDGSLVISAVGSDQVSLEVFQSFARMALQGKNIRIEMTHTSDLYSGDLYDQIIISRL